MGHRINHPGYLGVDFAKNRSSSLANIPNGDKKKINSCIKDAQANDYLDEIAFHQHNINTDKYESESPYIINVIMKKTHLLSSINLSMIPAISDPTLNPIAI